MTITFVQIYTWPDDKDDGFWFDEDPLSLPTNMAHRLDVSHSAIYMMESEGRILVQ